MQQVKSVMETNVKVLRPESTIREAADKMRTLNIGAIPICENERVLGMITDRDIVVRALAQGRDPERTRVNEIMTKEVIYCLEDQDVTDALERMRDRKVGRIVVLTPDYKLRGILSLGDIVQRLGENRMAGLVHNFVNDKGEKKPFGSKGVYVSLGTIASVATLFAGFQFFMKRQPNLANRLKGRVGFRERKAA